ncbi:MAG: FAD-dependent oxidoreductase, partial [Roseibium sp.]|uniref:FAD-dependent oxidoreductase n=1 Tax=Roseibium sp. TaxID=1936156 RepID=UPI00261161B7
MSDHCYEVAVIGAGIIGISTAYFLSKNHGISKIVLIDRDQPMAYTSAQSGENYRNWWPHPTMVNFTNRGIDLLEEIALAGNNSINMNRRGYALVTRSSDIQDLLVELHKGLGESAESLLRFHDGHNDAGYKPAHRPDWQDAPDGVDILSGQSLIQEHFPSYADDARNVIHIRRGGDISGQQLGMFMLEHLKEKGAQRVLG